MAHTLETGLELAQAGWPVFPLGGHKRPIIPKYAGGNGFHDATRDPALIASWWNQYRPTYWGVPLPDDIVVIDRDPRAAGHDPFALELPPTGVSQTTGGGGDHHFYRFAPGRVPVQGSNFAPGWDTRVAGVGYVVAWDPAALIDATEASFGEAPEWVYRAAASVERADAPDFTRLVTRSDILSLLGSLAVRAGDILTPVHYLALLSGLRDGGIIIDGDPERPWGTADFVVLAKEAGKWERPTQGQLILRSVAQPSSEPVETMTARQLAELEFAPLVEHVPGILTEGMGVLAAPPKSGKSLLAYQLGADLAYGAPVLGRPTVPTDVLYYALEDGKRRSKQRLLAALEGRQPPERFTFRWRAHRLTEGLEEEIAEWLVAHPGSVVIIDVLAKVRPSGSGKKSTNAYDEDYTALAGLHRVVTDSPGSAILLVTHDRKAGAEDWVTRITGTRGVSGVADFALFIARKRNSTSAQLYITGRDVPEAEVDMTFTGHSWRAQVAGDLIIPDTLRARVFAYLQEYGPATPVGVAGGLDMMSENQRARVRRVLGEMLDREEVVHRQDGAYAVPEET